MSADVSRYVTKPITLLLQKYRVEPNILLIIFECIFKHESQGNNNKQFLYRA